MSSKSVTRILIVDDHPVVRSGLRSLLEGEPGLEVCGEAGTLGEGLAETARLRPDLAIIDIALGSEDGLDLVKSIASRWPEVPMLVLSMLSERLYAELALKAGARGYLMKAEAPQTTIFAVRRIVDGGVYLSDEIQSRWLRRTVGGGPTAFTLPIETLTPRELSILRLLGQGSRIREIARALHVSPKTVETHRDNVRAKLGLSGASEVLQYAALWLEHAAAGETSREDSI